VAPAGGGVDATYAYDADGLRQSKTVNGQTRAFTWDTSGQLALLLMDGTDLYVYGHGNRPVARVDTTSGATHMLHGDQLGSIRVLTDQAGTVIGTYTYDAWGNTTGHTGGSLGLQYAGEYRDEETEFIYLRARHYDPQTGQFLTRDPLMAVTMSAYGYTGNTPLNGTDPSGHCATGAVVDTVACIFIAEEVAAAAVTVIVILAGTLVVAGVAYEVTDNACIAVPTAPPSAGLMMAEESSVDPRDVHGQLADPDVDVDEVWENGELYIQEEDGQIVRVRDNGNGTSDVVVRDPSNPSGEPTTKIKDMPNRQVDARVRDGRWR
jgi:RHS repeat-associated protein